MKKNGFAMIVRGFKMRLNIIWKANKPIQMGVIETTETYQGVQVAKSWEDAQDFVEDMAVTYGEQGGGFEVLMAFEGKTLETARRYYSAREFDMHLRLL